MPGTSFWLKKRQSQQGWLGHLLTLPLEAYLARGLTQNTLQGIYFPPGTSRRIACCSTYHGVMVTLACTSSMIIDYN